MRTNLSKSCLRKAQKPLGPDGVILGAVGRYEKSLATTCKLRFCDRSKPSSCTCAYTKAQVRINNRSVEQKDDVTSSSENFCFLSLSKLYFGGSSLPARNLAKCLLEVSFCKIGEVDEGAVLRFHYLWQTRPNTGKHGRTRMSTYSARC